MRDASVTRKSRARRLPGDATAAERIDAAKFVRQDAIGAYVVDFVCRERRLIVEVDGGEHATDKRGASRQRRASAGGNRAVRFCNDDVLANPDGALDSIAAALRRLGFIASNSAGAQHRGEALSPRPCPRTPRTSGEGPLAPCLDKPP